MGCTKLGFPGKQNQCVCVCVHIAGFWTRRYTTGFPACLDCWLQILGLDRLHNCMRQFFVIICDYGAQDAKNPAGSRPKENQCSSVSESWKRPMSQLIQSDKRSSILLSLFILFQSLTDRMSPPQYQGRQHVLLSQLK